MDDRVMMTMTIRLIVATLFLQQALDAILKEGGRVAHLHEILLFLLAGGQKCVHIQHAG